MNWKDFLKMPQSGKPRTPSKDKCLTFKDLLRVTGIPVLFASLCCLAPLVLVLFGLSGVAFAASLSDTLYFGYAWAFRAIGLVLLTVSLVIYFRKKGVCSLDEAKRQRRKIINTVLIVLVIAIVVYLFFLYIVVGYFGGLLDIWEFDIGNYLPG